ncbi:CaiB/BaiF CoA-transferase family protein [Caballeronia sp. GAWG1-1]|uniref:CaiB/BaiF CoA transferase family protein n=1 Tax=Caballeronia sp. GAWG1-1 TaxID=2921742 RepID=UPI002027D5BB|nr:CaiB/BaiF CoA-transferase family protein [Caballeronia sp. GAWG1-1]
MMLPLEGVKVVDFSTLLPGPLCTLLMAEAGANVIKVEKPSGGDEMRSYVPKAGPDAVNFGMLNRGKRSTVLDLKSQTGREAAMTLIDEADVLVEQFRPGVMARLGLGFDAVRARNPRLIYCSITAFGQSGPKAAMAAHDLNCLAQTGMLALSAGIDGAPVLPPALIGDIAGGAYPAMMNILLALRQREQTGVGSRLDISMADGLFTLMYWAIGKGTNTGEWPKPAAEFVTGGNARYQIYRTSDGGYLAAAPLEETFWRNFTRVIGAPELATRSGLDTSVKERVSALIASETAKAWADRFKNVDACTVRVIGLEEALENRHFIERGLLDRKVRMPGGELIAALPVPLAGALRTEAPILDAPALGASKPRFAYDP